MDYLTGRYALNIPCKLNTTGDWHYCTLDWDNPLILNSDDSIFGNYGLEPCNQDYHRNSPPFKANHLRACLDLFALNKLGSLQRLRADILGNDEYTEELITKLYLLKGVAHWKAIDAFMLKEYPRAWTAYKELRGDSDASIN